MIIVADVKLDTWYELRGISGGNRGRGPFYLRPIRRQNEGGAKLLILHIREVGWSELGWREIQWSHRNSWSEWEVKLCDPPSDDLKLEYMKWLTKQ